LAKQFHKKGLSSPASTKTFAKGIFPAMVIEKKCNGKQDSKDHQTDILLYL
jgi:hypothetical protein